MAWVSVSSVSWVRVLCWRKLFWVAWSTVARSLVRKPSSCLTVVVDVADGLVREFMLRIPFVFLGDALLPVDVPLLQVCPDVSYLGPAVVGVSAGLGGVGVEEGRQLLLRIPEVMEHVP